MIDEYSNMLIRDPYFKNHFLIPASLKPYFLKSSGELPPVQWPSIVDVWSTEPSRFRGFPSFKVDFYKWYPRIMADAQI